MPWTRDLCLRPRTRLRRGRGRPRPRRVPAGRPPGRPAPAARRARCATASRARRSSISVAASARSTTTSFAPGLDSMTDVDGSSAYLDAAREEARRQGDHRPDRLSPRGLRPARRRDRAGRCRHPPAGPVLLPGHAGAWSERRRRRARRSYGVIYPRSTWWMRAAAAAYDALRPVEGSASGPGYVHAESDVDAAVCGGQGFAPRR